MAPTKDKKSDDFDFLMICLQNCESLPKIDFAKVATITGAKDSKTCYKKHWTIMKKYGLTANQSTTASTAASTSTTATNKRKRAAPKKKPADEADAVGDIEDSPEENKTRAKKAKGKDREDTTDESVAIGDEDED